MPYRPLISITHLFDYFLIVFFLSKLLIYTTTKQPQKPLFEKISIKGGHYHAEYE